MSTTSSSTSSQADSTFFLATDDHPTSSNTTTSADAGRARRRKQKNGDALHRQRKAANERERKRMCSINKGFDKLRLRLPTPPYEKKLSKVDTLKQAINYIRELSHMLDERNTLGGEKFELIPAPQPPTLIITSSPNDPNADVLSLSWSRTPDAYGTAIRDERGVARVRCSKVWIPGT